MLPEPSEERDSIFTAASCVKRNRTCEGFFRIVNLPLRCFENDRGRGLNPSDMTTYTDLLTLFTAVQANGQC